MTIRLRSAVTVLSTLLAGLAWPILAQATETGGTLPWNQPLDVLKENLTGPTATVLIFIAVAFGFIIWSFSDNNHALLRVFKGLIALAVIATIGGFLTSLGISAALV